MKDFEHPKFWPQVWNAHPKLNSFHRPYNLLKDEFQAMPGAVEPNAQGCTFVLPIFGPCLSKENKGFCILMQMHRQISTQ